MEMESETCCFIDEDISYEDTKTEYEITMEKEEKKYFTIIQIGELYDKIIKEYQNGNDLIFDPNVFAKLTKAKFIDWVILNNNDLFNLYFS